MVEHFDGRLELIFWDPLTMEDPSQELIEA